MTFFCLICIAALAGSKVILDPDSQELNFDDISLNRYPVIQCCFKFSKTLPSRNHLINCQAACGCALYDLIKLTYTFLEWALRVILVLKAYIYYSLIASVSSRYFSFISSPLIAVDVKINKDVETITFATLHLTSSAYPGLIQPSVERSVLRKIQYIRYTRAHLCVCSAQVAVGQLLSLIAAPAHCYTSEYRNVCALLEIAAGRHHFISEPALAYKHWVLHTTVRGDI